MKPTFTAKVSLITYLQPVKCKSYVHDPAIVLPTSALRKPARQTSKAHTQSERHKCDKANFSLQILA